MLIIICIVAAAVILPVGLKFYLANGHAAAKVLEILSRHEI